MVNRICLITATKELSGLIPGNHILKKINKFIDFSFIYPKVKKLYVNNFGRPSIDPVLFFKKLIGYVFGIKSYRQLCQRNPIKYSLSLVLQVRNP